MGGRGVDGVDGHFEDVGWCGLVCQLRWYMRLNCDCDCIAQPSGKERFMSGYI